MSFSSHSLSFCFYLILSPLLQMRDKIAAFWFPQFYLNLQKKMQLPKSPSAATSFYLLFPTFYNISPLEIFNCKVNALISKLTLPGFRMRLYAQPAIVSFGIQGGKESPPVRLIHPRRRIVKPFSANHKGSLQMYMYKTISPVLLSPEDSPLHHRYNGKYHT